MSSAPKQFVVAFLFNAWPLFERRRVCFFYDGNRFSVANRNLRVPRGCLLGLHGWSVCASGVDTPFSLRAGSGKDKWRRPDLIINSIIFYARQALFSMSNNFFGSNMNKICHSLVYERLVGKSAVNRFRFTSLNVINQESVMKSSNFREILWRSSKLTTMSRSCYSIAIHSRRVWCLCPDTFGRSVFCWLQQVHKKILHASFLSSASPVICKTWEYSNKCVRSQVPVASKLCTLPIPAREQVPPAHLNSAARFWMLVISWRQFSVVFRLGGGRSWRRTQSKSFVQQSPLAKQAMSTLTTIEAEQQSLWAFVFRLRPRYIISAMFFRS